MTNGALVLAGGGLAGIAWEVGVLLGIEETAPAAAARLFASDTIFVGTSAGSVVASQVAGGVPLRTLFDLQLLDDPDVGATFDIAGLSAIAEKALAGVTSLDEARKRIGEMARDRHEGIDRSAVIAARLPVKEWSLRRVLITAVDADSGDLRVFERDSGVALVDAVAASCAVPLIWPTVEIEGRQYMDGGVRSSTNADLAAGADRILILSPSGNPMPVAELASLSPAPVHVIAADAASLRAFGNNPLDPAVWAASAAAGRAQGASVAAHVAEFWA
jgi:NTE family protein